jgi:putative phage-type endonuclease
MVEIAHEVKIVGDRTGQTPEDFVRMRRTYLGGSDAGAILGMSPYSSPLSVYCAKKGLWEPEDNEAMLWGRLLEPVIRDQWQERHPEFAIEQDPNIYRHPELEWMGGTIDGGVTELVGEPPDTIFGQRFGLEIKTGSEYAKEWGADEVPDHYYAQVQHYMALLDLPGFWVVALLGRKMVERYVPRNDEFIKYMLEEEQKFWETYIVPGKMPDPIGLSIDGDLLSMLYKEAVEQDPTPVLDEDIGKLVEVYEGFKKVMEDTEKDVARCKQLIEFAMGSAKVAKAGPYQLTWSRWTTKRFNGKAFAKDHPEEYEQYKTQEVNTGRLTVKNVGMNEAEAE